jgi:hypothetical protein
LFLIDLLHSEQTLCDDVAREIATPKGRACQRGFSFTAYITPDHRFRHGNASFSAVVAIKK